MTQGMNDWAVEQTARGLFWRPDESADDPYPGTLTLKSDGGAVLELFGQDRDWVPSASQGEEPRPALIPGEALLFFFEQPSHRRILGAAEDLGFVTLDRCVANGWKQSLQVRLSSASYRVETVIRGLCYETDEPTSFCSLGFHAAGLKQMLHRLDDQETTLDDDCVLRFVPDSDRTTAHAEIEPQAAATLLHLSKHALAVRDFLTLAYMRESAIYAMWAIEENAPDDHKKVDIRASIPWNKPGVKRDFINPEAMLFATDDMKGNLADTVGRWMHLYTEYADAVNLYFTNQFMTYAPIHVKLSMLFRAVDAWYRVERAVPDNKPTPSLGKALGDLIDEYTGDLEMSFSMLADVERVRKMRNAITHPGRTTSLWAGDTLEYVATERQLTALMQICMLRKIGFSDDIVKHIVSRDAIKLLLHTKFIEFV